MSFSADGSKIAVIEAGSSGKAIIFDALNKYRPLVLDSGRVQKASFSSNGSRVVLVGADMEIYDTVTGEMLTRVKNCHHKWLAVTGVTHSADGRYFATLQGSVVVWHAENGEMLLSTAKSVPGGGWPKQVAFTLDGAGLFMLSEYSGVTYWDLPPPSLE
ncbi:hypothetical protein [Streptomyces sp. NBC_01443]|uniref:WD40 repeat domain-containing protein n=1 Tax=Streptomyces sp. NBC_01443 TaxID=2903868 RepID=UPI0022505E91|nr:hypothetical protein [Streptomyces sp. NBC_01443]MCX4633099.1 hypothetical protein [Streptomyces sp. NBC_01443]